MEPSFAPSSLESKELELEQFIGRYRSVLVAFSGGVDSAYLAFTAHRVLGKESWAVTALSPSVSQYQEQLAVDFAGRFHLNHQLIHTAEMSRGDYVRNPVDRCYHCKSELYDHLERLRRKWKVEVILDGTNADDSRDHRPGRKAAAEWHVKSPLADLGFAKQEIRLLSRQRGLPSWDQPAMPCLSSRVPYGEPITGEALSRIERSEAVLREMGLKNFRVRHHADLARIEVDREEISLLMDPERFDQIVSRLKSFGYRFVTLDLQGFRSGSLNDAVSLQAPALRKP